MELRDDDGTSSFSLTPLSYQFGTADNIWDANWLTMKGHVTAVATWSFVDACLSTTEARELVGWLHRASRAEVTAVAAHSVLDTEGLLAFLEPCLAFSVAGYPSGEAVTVRVHLSLEAGDPTIWQEGRPEFYSEYLELTMSRASLDEAATAFAHELEPFPSR